VNGISLEVRLFCTLMLDCFADLVTLVRQCRTHALTLEKVDCCKVDPVQTLYRRYKIVCRMSLLKC